MYAVRASGERPKNGRASHGAARQRREKSHAPRLRGRGYERRGLRKSGAWESSRLGKWRSPERVTRGQRSERRTSLRLAELDLVPFVPSLPSPSQPTQPHSTLLLLTLLAQCPSLPHPSSSCKLETQGQTFLFLKPRADALPTTAGSHAASQTRPRSQSGSRWTEKGSTSWPSILRGRP